MTVVDLCGLAQCSLNYLAKADTIYINTSMTYLKKVNIPEFDILKVHLLYIYCAVTTKIFMDILFGGTADVMRYHHHHHHRHHHHHHNSLSSDQPSITLSGPHKRHGKIDGADFSLLSTRRVVIATEVECVYRESQ